MTYKKIKKIVQRAIARNALYIFTWLFNKLPYPFVCWLSRVLITIGFAVAGRHVKIAEESLKIAFGDEKTDAERKQISKECFVNVGKSMIELVYFMDHPNLISEKTFFEGKHHLDKALAQGKGAVAVSAHFGSFPLMLLRLSKDYPTNAIIRPARDEKIEKYFVYKRTQRGLKTIYSLPRKQCVDRTIKALRNNEIMFIPLDQNYGSGKGVFVDFFGQKAATATGPVVFSLRTGAPIIPIFTIRDKDDMHKIIVEPPFELEIGADDKDTIQINVAKITKLIESYIRRYPEEWGWMHKRWKSRPKGEAS